ncbi:MAG: sensor histidine kinase, partial [Arcobacteraceae bacterium]
MKIKAKLILLFIIIKVIPLILILFMSLTGIQKLSEIIEKKAQSTLSNSIEVIKETTDLAIKDSIEALDKKSQESLEIITKNIASNVASFLYQRDNDVLFLANMSSITQQKIKKFYDANTRDIIIPQEFEYDSQNDKWIIPHFQEVQEKNLAANLIDNQRYFTHHKDKQYKTKTIYTYKELAFIDLKGNEKIKV